MTRGHRLILESSLFENDELVGVGEARAEQVLLVPLQFFGSGALLPRPVAICTLWWATVDSTRHAERKDSIAIGAKVARLIVHPCRAKHGCCLHSSSGGIACKVEIGRTHIDSGSDRYFPVGASIVEDKEHVALDNFPFLRCFEGQVEEKRDPFF